MIVIGANPHKDNHTAVAADCATGELRSSERVAASPAGHEALLGWGRGLDSQRVWAVEDCRHVSGALERFLIARGERVGRVAPKLMAGARRGARERGKSDPIDAAAVARAALREGIENLPQARLEGPEPGCGPLTAAKLIAECAGAERFSSDAKLARAAGVAPLPVSSGRRDRHRLDRGGNRQLNCAFHRIAVTQARMHPDAQTFIARKRAEGKSNREALRCLKRHLVRRVHRLLTQPPTPASALDNTLALT